MHASGDLTPDAVVLASRQAGVLSRSQLLGCGVNPRTVTRLARRWQPIGRGVYLTTPTADGTLPWPARAWGGLLLAGSGSRLWSRDAAVIHGLLDMPAAVSPMACADLPVALLIPDNRGPVQHPGFDVTRERPGIRLPSTQREPACTRIEDTVIDLCAGGTAEDAVTWLTRAVQRRRTTPRRVAARLGERDRVRNRRIISDVLADVAGGTTSHLEFRTLRDVLQAHGLPTGSRQMRVSTTGYVTDFAFTEYGLLIEVDGRIGHVEEGAWRDRRRDNAHALAGWTTLRFGWAEVTTCPCELAAQVAAVLRARGWPGEISRCTRCSAGSELWV